MRKKRKILYLVRIPNYWYFPKIKRWLHEDILMDKNYSEHRGLIFKNILTFKTCRVFEKYWPVGTIITKKVINKGKILWIDYIITKRSIYKDKTIMTDYIKCDW